MNRTRSAFTLLEVMLAITILGLVMAAVFSTWSAGLNGWKRTSNVSDNFQRERIVMGTLTDLTKSLVFVPNKDELYEVTFEHNLQTGDTISFVTGSTALLPPTEAVAAGMRRVTISMQRDQHGHMYLGIANAPAVVATDESEKIAAAPHVLSTEVSGFSVRLRSPHDGTMKDRWDEPDIPPSAIEYTIAFGVNDGRTPPIVITRTVDLPVAQYALQLAGQALNQQNTTNTVTRRDIDLPKNSGGDSE